MTNFKVGEKIPIYADDFRSTVSISEYDFFEVNWCDPSLPALDKTHEKTDHHTERIENRNRSPYFYMVQNKTHTEDLVVDCERTFDED
jgi:hypothetical protein